MPITIEINLPSDQMLQIARDKWYSERQVYVKENIDWSRENAERANPQKYTTYLQKVYKDLIVSDIVNTIIWYKARPDEEVDVDLEKTTRQSIEKLVSVTIA